MSRIINFTLLSALLFALSAIGVNGANILVVFTSHSPSHLIVHMSMMKALAERGHNITVFATMEPKITHKNIKTFIIPLPAAEEQTLAAALKQVAVKKQSIINSTLTMFKLMGIMVEAQFEAVRDKRFTWIYEHPETRFDVAFVGFFMNSFQLGIAAKLKIPVIVSWTSMPMDFTDALVGNPRHIRRQASSKPSFGERLKNLAKSHFIDLMRIFVDYRMNAYYKRLFADDLSMPSYYEAKKNVSLLFCNSHALSEGDIRPNVPAVIEVGGILVKDKPEPLTADIAKFLDKYLIPIST